MESYKPTEEQLKFCKFVSSFIADVSFPHLIIIYIGQNQEIILIFVGGMFRNLF